MPRQHEGESYLSGPEAREYLATRLGVTSDTTFRELIKEHSIPSWNFTGAGRTNFYKQSDLDKIPVLRPGDTSGK